MARTQVESFIRYAEKNKQQLRKENMNFADLTDVENTLTARAYIEATMQTYDLDMQIVTALRGEVYSVLVFKISRFK